VKTVNGCVHCFKWYLWWCYRAKPRGADMDLDEVVRNVKSGAYKLQTHNSKKHKVISTCWDSFKDLIDADENKLYGVACCSFCSACIIVKRKKVRR